MDMNSYQARALTTRTDAARALFYPALGLGGEAGEVLDQVKRVFRDDGGLVTPARRDKVRQELGDVLWYAAVLAADFGLSLSECAEANLTKLASRKLRGVLSGEGGER